MDVAVVEGVMGLYDGDLSTASLACALGLPVLLVVDGYGMAESAGPLVKGFRNWGLDASRRGAPLAGVIFNRVASQRHFDRLSKSVEDVPVLGYLPRDLRFEIPHRHLGLVVAEEHPISIEALDRLADTVLEHVDVDRLLSLCDLPPHLPGLWLPLRRVRKTRPAACASPLRRITPSVSIIRTTWTF